MKEGDGHLVHFRFDLCVVHGKSLRGFGYMPSIARNAARGKRFEGLRFGEVKSARRRLVWTHRALLSGRSVDERQAVAVHELFALQKLDALDHAQMTETTDSQPQETTVIASCAMPMPMRPW